MRSWGAAGMRCPLKVAEAGYLVKSDGRLGAKKAPFPRGCVGKGAWGLASVSGRPSFGADDDLA